MRLTNEKRNELKSIIFARYKETNSNSKLFDDLRIECKKLLDLFYKVTINSNTDKVTKEVTEFRKKINEFNTKYDHAVSAVRMDSLCEKFPLSNFGLLKEFSYETLGNIVEGLSLDDNPHTRTPAYNVRNPILGLNFQYPEYPEYSVQFPDTLSESQKKLITKQKSIIKKLLLEIGKIGTAYSTFKDSIENVLKKATTVKKLTEAWPAVAELIPSSWDQPKNTQLVVPQNTFNTLLDIPTEK